MVVAAAAVVVVVVAVVVTAQVCRAGPGPKLSLIWECPVTWVK